MNGWEVAHSLDPKSASGVNGAQGDPDGDLLTNLEELNHATNPQDADSDDDTLSDYAEVMTHLTSPIFADTDGDTLGDAAEINIHLTNPTLWDTDSDSLSDGAEVNTHLTSPLSKDSDNDGLNDDVEINTHQTNPNAADSDNDGISDKSEIKQGTNANSASSLPAFESVEVVGDGAAGVRKTKQLTITLPQGERSYLVVIAAYSEEYPQYTGLQSEFDDVLDWKITPAGGTVIEGSKHVNDLHEDWEQSETDGTSLLGLSPVAVVKIETIQGKATGTTSVQIELGAKNVSDALLPSTLAAAVLPVEIKRDEEGGSVSWDAISGNVAKVLPGQKVNLKLDTSLLPSGYAVTNHNWTVTGGKFANYTASSSTAVHTSLVTSDFTGAELHFYWAQTGIQTVTLRCNINGAPTTMTTQINVVDPGSSLTRTSLDSVGQPDAGVVKLGTFSIAGIKFQASVNSIVSEFGEEGEWQFVQVVNSGAYATRNDGVNLRIRGFGEDMLDTNYPYTLQTYQTGQTNDAQDSPETRCLWSNQVHGTTDQFAMHLMFKPPGANTKWVPLRVLNWSWQWKATRISDDLLTNWTLSDQAANAASNGSITHTHPEWLGNIDPPQLSPVNP